MYCKNCGKQLSDGAIMCPECGEPTKTSVALSGATDNITETHEETTQKSNPLAAIGFFLSMFAFVTGIVFGAFMYVFVGAAALVLVIGPACILPALAGISIGIYALKNAKGTQKGLAIAGIVLAAVVLLFLFLTACIVCSFDVL